MVNKMEEMKKHGLTDEEVEQEITRLQKSPYVELARKEQRIRYKRRQYLYSLRSFEKRGIELTESGITLDMLDDFVNDSLGDDYCA